MEPTEKQKQEAIGKLLSEMLGVHIIVDENADLMPHTDIDMTSANMSDENGPLDEEPEPDGNLDEDGYLLPTHPEYCSQCHVLNLIDDVMINTLSKSAQLEKSSAETLLILSHIRNDYLAGKA